MTVTRRGALLGSVSPLRRFASVRASADPPVHIAVIEGSGLRLLRRLGRSHLSANGYAVSVTESDDLDGVKKKLGIPEDLRACHTGQTGRVL